jgi:hypothetical protein
MEVNDQLYAPAALFRGNPFYCQFGRRENGFQTGLDAVKKAISIVHTGN